MGLLDDAIREHLELKRRRGADPAEIERLEREALGPVRRTPAETLEDQPETVGNFETDDAIPTASEPGAPAPPGGAAPSGGAPPPTAAPEPLDHEAGRDETAEYEVENERVSESTESADMLEETPEFLQDTPDHDRLWFEQRPPRDFDFDD
jgi:hypothetical protein